MKPKAPQLAVIILYFSGVPAHIKSQSEPINFAEFSFKLLGSIFSNFIMESFGRATPLSTDKAENNARMFRIKKMFFWFYKRGFNPLKNNQNPIDVRALKMPRFYCNHTAFLTSRLYFRTIAQCKFWEWHNRSAYAAKFFRRLHASEFVLRNRKKNCFQFIERNPARRQSNNIYLLRLIKSIFYPKPTYNKNIQPRHTK